MTGFQPAHRPQQIGCHQCHQGDPSQQNKTNAHQGLITIPGNLKQVSRTCGTTDCHPWLSAWTQDSLMATGRGMIGVNRYVFGESKLPQSDERLSQLGQSRADRHLRHLCASCHLAQPKTQFGPITEMSRGGGCNSCHLVYSHDAKVALTNYQTSGQLPRVHPALSIQASDQHCFGCHARSGRISTSYQGWHETLLYADEIPKGQEKNYRQLKDGRIFSKQPADIHFEKGLSCIDCHTWRETMGDGNTAYHSEEQLEISCHDCHFRGQPTTIAGRDIGAIDKSLWQLRTEQTKDLTPTRRFLVTKKSGNPLLHLSPIGRPTPDGHSPAYQLQSKITGRRHHLPTPASACDRLGNNHQRLSCRSCHTAWAPHCVGCHMEYDAEEEGYDHLARQFMPGMWDEEAADFRAALPTLGVRFIPQQGESSELTPETEKIITFVPGMILTIAGDKTNPKTIFKRLYAPLFSHTIRKQGRDCQSCHQNPVALGYGRGQLIYEPLAEGTGQFRFVAARPLSPEDQRPEDAWIGFLETRGAEATTRTNTRPFNRQEQERILTVGACLSCHPDTVQQVSTIYQNFPRKYLQALANPNCITPVFGE